MTSTIGIKKIQHPNATSALTIGSDGVVTFSQPLGATTISGTTTFNAAITGDSATFNEVGVFADRLQVGKSNIVNAYSATNSFGYIADFQSDTGGQTYISFAEPGVASLGDNGSLLGEDTVATYLWQRGNKDLKFGTADATRMIIDSDGDISVGNEIKPTNKFDVDGAVRKRGDGSAPSGLSGGLVCKTPIYSEYHYTWSGTTNHRVELTCGSYFMSTVEFVSSQTNGGSDIQVHRYGKWANNHTTHTWNQYNSSGSNSGMSLSISASQNNVSNSGKLTITQNYSSGSYSGSRLVLKVYYGGFNISKPV